MQTFMTYLKAGGKSIGNKEMLFFKKKIQYFKRTLSA